MKIEDLSTAKFLSLSNIPKGGLWIKTGPRIDIDIELEKVIFLDGEVNKASEIPVDSDILVLQSHGEGAHLKFVGSVLCASPDNECQPFGCKRSEAGKREIVKLDQLHGKILIILSCFSFSTNDEFYPSKFSIVKTALNNFDIIITTPLEISVKPRDMEIAALCAITSHNAKELLESLNIAFGTRKSPKPFIGLGNPNTTFSLSTGIIKKELPSLPKDKLYKVEDIFLDYERFIISEVGGIAFCQDGKNNQENKTFNYFISAKQREQKLNGLKKSHKIMQEIKTSSTLNAINYTIPKTCESLMQDIEEKFRDIKSALVKELECRSYTKSLYLEHGIIQKKMRRFWQKLFSHFLNSTFTVNPHDSESLTEKVKKGKLKINSIPDRDCDCCGNLIYKNTYADVLDMKDEVLVEECPVCGVTELYSSRVSRVKLVITFQPGKISWAANSKVKGRFLWVFQLVDKIKPKNNITTWKVTNSQPYGEIFTDNLSKDRICISVAILNIRHFGVAHRIVHNI